MLSSQPQRKDWLKMPKSFILIAEQTLHEKKIPAYLLAFNPPFSFKGPGGYHFPADQNI